MEDNKADVLLVEEAIRAQAIRAELQVITEGEEAIRRIERGAADWIPDLLILDLNLPKRSGLEILACIRQSVEYAHVPVLIMTSSDAEKDRQETTRLGASGYFRKPSGLDEFLQIGVAIKALLVSR